MVKLSIITINFNDADGLQKTIDSVANQTYKDFEYIIIDGASTDGSVEIIEKHADKLAYWISEPDTGIYNAMNKGIAAATGGYLMFLNSGDYLINNEILARCYDYVLNNPETDIFYGDMLTGDKNPAKPRIRTHPEVLDLFFFKYDNINHQASFISASLFEKFGLYPDEYKLASDHWLYLKSFVENKTFKHINLSMVSYNGLGQSHSKRADYNVEMDLIWKSLVPQYVDYLTDQIYNYKVNTDFKFVKAAISISLNLLKVDFLLKSKMKLIKKRIKLILQ